MPWSALGFSATMIGWSCGKGEIVSKAPIGSRNVACVKRLNALLSARLGSRAVVSVQDPVQLGERSEPQPDLALLTPRADFYAGSHPGPGDVLRIIEVADTSAETDREVKVPLYARAGIREMWLVDLETRRVEVYRGPSPGSYQDVQRLGDGESVVPTSFPGAALTLREVLFGVD